MSIQVWRDSSGHGKCRSCHAPLVWFETVAGKRMPINAGRTPVSTTERGGRTVLEFTAADTHWSTCPQARTWKRARA